MSQEWLGLEFTDERHTAVELEVDLLAQAQPDTAVSAIPHFIKPQPTAGQRPDQTGAVHHYLAGARRAIEAADTAPHLANSPALSVPILGKLWQQIRGQMHDLVLFYVNRAGRTHSRTDGQLIEAVEALAQLVEQQQAEIERLTNEIDSQDGG